MPRVKATRLLVKPLIFEEHCRSRRSSFGGSKSVVTIEAFIVHNLLSSPYLKIGKKENKGKPYHGGGVYEFLDVDIDRLSYFELRDCLKELGYEPGQCVLYVKLPRSTVMLEIKFDYDTTLIAECLSHGDILDCFVCHFVVDPVLVPPLLEYGESGVGDGASQNNGPNASFDVELEPTHEAQENATHEAQENASNLASNSAPVNSNTSSHVHYFTAPNTPPPIHQTLTPIHPSTDQLLTIDVDDELRSFREERSKRKRRKRGERAPLPDHVKLGTKKKGPDVGYDESTSGNRNNLEGKLAGNEPYYPSDEAASFETDPDAFSDDEEEVQQREKVKPRRRKKVNRVVFDASSQKVVWELSLVFESVNEFRSAVTKYAVAEHVAIEMYINEPTRTYNPVHKCVILIGTSFVIASSYLVTTVKG
ncbi:hypothetical protein KY290_012299 [Solanum tuberosum]|uniref:PB1-like domain-containing protein n=1 Tax=Solanum tuberosum TaxID=4113 RepID=A0ABQ7W329_SOLTU|nr:hypothetical protein KY290_012299 [Solanum tuberosum]